MPTLLVRIRSLSQMNGGLRKIRKQFVGDLFYICIIAYVVVSLCSCYITGDLIFLVLNAMHLHTAARANECPTTISRIPYIV